MSDAMVPFPPLPRTPRLPLPLVSCFLLILFSTGVGSGLVFWRGTILPTTTTTYHVMTPEFSSETKAAGRGRARPADGTWTMRCAPFIHRDRI